MTINSLYNFSNTSWDMPILVLFYLIHIISSCLSYRLILYLFLIGRDIPNNNLYIIIYNIQIQTNKLIKNY